MAEVIARETGTELLPLHGLHNISRDDLASRDYLYFHHGT